VTEFAKRCSLCEHEKYSATQKSSLFQKFQLSVLVKMSEVRCGQYCVTMRLQ
jgi:hypothetical protein